MKLKSSTLIEVLIAMVIIAFVFLIGGSIYINLQSRISKFQKLKADLAISQVYAETIESKAFFQETVEVNGVMVLKKVEESIENSVITLSASVNEIELLERKYIVKYEE